MDAGEARTYVGRTLRGRYHLESVIGTGGMGAVYRARHLFLERLVAVKLIECPGEERRKRSLREARATARLTSVHAVRIFDADFTEDGLLFLAMELLTGTDLAALVEASGPMKPALAVDAALQAGLALLEAHRLGIVHRDVKPANLFRDATGLVKLIDFGVSKFVDAPSVTQSSAVLGSPLFMSPEQLVAPASVGPHSDLWSLSVTLYYLLSGRYPFAGEAAAVITTKILREAPTALPPREGLSPALRELVMRGLSREPAERASRPLDWLTALSAFSTGGASAWAARLEAAATAPLAPEVPLNQTLDLAPPRAERPASLPAAISGVTPSRAARWPFAAGALGLAALGLGFWVMRERPPEPAAAAAARVEPVPVVVEAAPPPVEVARAAEPADAGLHRPRPRPAADPANLQLK